MSEPKLTLFHAPNTRSYGARVLLEELGAPFDLHVVNMKAGEQRSAAYLAVNPMGKVPAVRHGDAVVTEQAAVFMYLADAFPAAGLAPGLGDPLRGAYLRWMIYYGSCFEPAVVDRALKRETLPTTMCPYGDYATMLDTVRAQIAKGPYLLGERFTAADILWGAGLMWTTGFGIVEKTPDIEAYIGRVTSRPSFGKIRADDARLSAEHAAAAEVQAKAP